MDRISSPKPPVAILLAEDNPGDVYIVRSSLADSAINHNFYHVDDGEEVMNYLHQEQGYENAVLPNLILLDLNLPKKNGFEVLTEVKTDPKLKLIPIVILTSSHADEDIFRSYQLLANSYIVKSSDYFTFFQAIKNLELFWLNLAQLPCHDESGIAQQPCRRVSSKLSGASLRRELLQDSWEHCAPKAMGINGSTVNPGISSH